jgi:hypothetical protein
MDKKCESVLKKDETKIPNTFAPPATRSIIRTEFECMSTVERQEYEKIAIAKRKEFGYTREKIIRVL